jgi:signal transduction histidine kinase
MSKRILAGFLTVLAALLALVVVPLGIKVSAQQHHDFLSTALAQARALASSEEERLGDTSDPADAHRATPPAMVAGDGVVVLGRHGEIVVRAGRPVPDDVIRAARVGTARHLGDAVTVLAGIGPTSGRDGTVVLVRDREPLDRRVHALWLALALAACITIAFGAVTAAGLARWIAHPLRGLESAATRMGHGDVGARATVHSGPPEVRAVGAAFNDMADRIATLLNSQRAMTADVSHQLRTPLSALQLRLELLADEAPDTVATELLDALREIARLNRLLDGLLAVARAEESKGEQMMADVASVVEERVQMWQPVAQDAGVTLTTSLEPARTLLTSGHLEQVLDNLVANAVDALPAGGCVTVSTKVLRQQVVVAVADDGPGMPAARRLNALERFESDGAGRKAGLGLAIVARLVATDHGSVALEETPGGGLTALIRLPRDEPDA